MPEQPESSWRDAAGAPTVGSSRAWQPGDTARPATALPARRRLLRLVAACALCAFVVGFGVVLLWLRPSQPACLVLLGSGYEQNLLLPHNVHGWHGLTTLDQAVAQDTQAAWRWPWNPPTRLRRVSDPVEVGDQSWSDVWNRLEVAAYPEKAVVVALSMHGMADRDEAYLLPNATVKPSAQAFDQARIPFRDVLESLKTLKNCNIVLLLDTAQVSAHWPIGMLHNDFVARLQEKYDSQIRAMGNLVVICACSPEQRSWASDDLQNSVFGHYVTLGLQGAGHNAHERVTAWSLFKYVEDKVDRWVLTNRARQQTPLLLGDEALAREVEIAYIAEPIAEPDLPTRTVDTDGLRAEWKRWHDLRQARFAAICAPHLWRLYQDVLLRYEQLTRAGDPTGKAAALRNTLTRLYGDLVAAQHVDRTFASLPNNLLMPAFLGYEADPALSQPALQAFLANLRKAPTSDERAKLIAKYRDKSPRDRQYLLVALSGLVLQDAAALTLPECLREAERLIEVERELRVPLRPAEAQLLAMLQDADPALDSETVRAALRTQIAAEETALGSTDGLAQWYAAAVSAWTRGLAEKGDAARRAGQDRLFGDPKLDALTARLRLQEAGAQYTDARSLAKRVARALELRDSLTAALPYYAAWLAASPAVRANQGDVRVMEGAVQNLGVGLAALSQSLDVEHKLPADETLNRLGADARLLQDGMAAAAERLRKGAVLQQNWHALDALLSVPPASAEGDAVDLRLALVGRQRHIAGELARSTDLEGQPEVEEPVRVRVERQRRLLRACVRPGTDVQGPDRGNLDEAARDWLLKTPPEVVRRATGSVDDDAEPALVEATQLCRVLPGFAADLVRNEQGSRLNPVDRLRRLRVRRLMLWLAERAWQDHWFEPGPTRRDTYYLPVAKGYLETAAGLFDRAERAPAYQSAVTALKEKLVPAGLEVTRKANPFWTTEFRFPLTWQIEAGPLAPQGTPMVWLDVIGADRSLTVQQPEPRKAIAVWPTAKTPFAEPFFVNRKNVPADAKLAVRLHTLYRGQHRVHELPLVRGSPNTIVRQVPAPDKAALAVRMDSAFDYGAISIVLDNSGSMNFVYPAKDDKDRERRADRKAGERRRFDYALDALAHVLRKVPDNTFLSITTLGRKQGTGYVTGATEYRPPTRWRRQQLDEVIADLSEIPGDIASPIADGIARSMTSGFPADFRGPKVVVVLTDGDDNWSFGSTYDPRTEPDIARHSQTVAAGLRKLAAEHPDVLLYLVCFIEPDRPEFPRAVAQFKGIEQFEPPGKFLVVREAERLGDAIEGLMRPRLVLQLDGRPAPGHAKGEPVNFPGDLALNWSDVRPNTFRARISRTFGRDIAVELAAGHNLFALLKRGEKDYYLERGVLGRQPEIRNHKAMPSPREQAGWLASLLDNHSSLTNKLTQVAILEKMQVEKDRLRQSHPGFTWLEVTDKDGKRPPQTLTWGRDWSLPAAAFRLELPDWHAERPSRTTLWFWPEPRELLLAQEKLYARVSVPVGSTTPMKPTGRLLADPEIESALWEDRELETPTVGTVKEKCLVIRVRHAPGWPVYLMLDPERSGVGSEHEYFAAAARSTASFYRLPNLDIAHLIVIDVEAFKQAAARVQFIPDEHYRVPGMFINRLK